MQPNPHSQLPWLPTIFAFVKPFDWVGVDFGQGILREGGKSSHQIARFIQEIEAAVDGDSILLVFFMIHLVFAVFFWVFVGAENLG